VSSCTEDPSSELFEELANGGENERTDLAQLIDEEESEDEGVEWEPDPIDAHSSNFMELFYNGFVVNRSSKKSDILSMLVNIYGSPELFVNEYRSMLADKLLAITDYDTDKEVGQCSSSH
jgi:anaphase-promoting complex subunit 2